MNISLIGPSGAGKGTHASQLVSRFNLLHLCTGDLFREHLDQQTALGLLARRYMAQGEMVPDEVVDAMIEERVRRTAPVQGILFDGFPRTVYQAKFLDDLFRQLDRKLDAVVYLDVSDEEILNRIAGREVCQECRLSFRRIYHPFTECPRKEDHRLQIDHRPQATDHGPQTIDHRHTEQRTSKGEPCNGEHLYRRPDDTPQIARARLRVFHRVTGPLLNYYQQTSRVVIVGGERDVAEVRGALNEAFARTLRDRRPAASGGEVGHLIARMSKPVPTLKPAVALDLILIGAPGSGKGTQAVTLAKEMGLPHIATGDLFRENLKKETELGKLAKTYMDRGELVPDDVTDAMVEERLGRADARDGFILDGYPRTLHQAEALVEMLAEKHRHVAAAIHLDVPDSEIVQRLSGRWICRQCQAPYHNQFKPSKVAGVCDACGGPLYQRDDDKAETVVARLKTFHAQTEPVIAYFRESGQVVDIQGTGAPAEVTARVLQAARVVQEKIVADIPGADKAELVPS